jgi:hypothetical protein
MKVGMRVVMMMMIVVMRMEMIMKGESGILI